jgi:hypothetical protein
MIQRRTQGLCALLAVAMISLAAAPARAQAYVGVVVTGEATMQPQLVAQLETWLRSHGHELVSAPLPPDAINALIDCIVIEDLGCAHNVVQKRSKSKTVVLAQVSMTTGAVPSDRSVTLTTYWIDKVKDPISERRPCERCTDAEVRNLADEMLATIAAKGAEHGKLKVSSTPSGATVSAGGKKLGKTPLEQELPAGKVELVIEHEGKPPEIRQVTVIDDDTVEVDVTFGSGGGSGKGLAYAALLGGVALGIAGGILIGIDEDATPGVPTYRDSAPPGIALSAAGAVAIGVGIYLFVRSPGRRDRSPTVSVVPGGGVIGWAGRF